MKNNNPNVYLQEDEIDLKVIFKLLINSKKLVIAITLIITTLGTIYSFQKETEYKSTALIVIGNYQQDQFNQTPIETAETLINEIAIEFIHSRQELDSNYNNLVMELVLEERKGVTNRLIQIANTSSSSVSSRNLLNDVIRYVENRHTNLLSTNTKNIEKQLTHEIEILNNEIEYGNELLFSQIEYEKLRISNQIVSLNNELPSLDAKIESLNEIIFADQNNLLLLKSNAELFIQRAAQSPTLNQVIFSYKTKLLDYENEKIELSSLKDNLELELKLLESNGLQSDGHLSLSQEIFKLSQEKYSLELELALKIQQNQTSTQLIGEIQTNKVATKKH